MDVYTLIMKNLVSHWPLKGVGIKEWKQYCKSGKNPNDIPREPRYVYKSKGWKGMGDWLGTGYVATFRRQYLSFAKVK